MLLAELCVLQSGDIPRDQIRRCHTFSGFGDVCCVLVFFIRLLAFFVFVLLYLAKIPHRKGNESDAWVNAFHAVPVAEAQRENGAHCRKDRGKETPRLCWSCPPGDYESMSQWQTLLEL